jgi:hypothetical protein
VRGKASQNLWKAWRDVLWFGLLPHRFAVRILFEACGRHERFRVRFELKFGDNLLRLRQEFIRFVQPVTFDELVLAARRHIRIIARMTARASYDQCGGLSCRSRSSFSPALFSVFAVSPQLCG